ncbi:hypothetical protein ACHAWF_010461 [Thalassiosira exigua]
MLIRLAQPKRRWKFLAAVGVDATTRRRRLSHCAGSAGYSTGGDAILFLSPSNWPEPNSTAAGTRTMSLLKHFSSRDSPFGSVHFGCGAKFPPAPSNAIGTSGDGIHWHRIKPNRSDEMKALLQRIEHNHAPIRAVVFDRFYAEEAFSFRIRETCPSALLVLDMQDVHSLRLGRQCLVEEADSAVSDCSDGQSVSDGNACHMTEQLMEKVITKAYDAFLRELASVHRSDLVLVCSSEEVKLLESWNVPDWKLVPASFFCTDLNETSEVSREFEDRKDFVALGGFKHAPNVDSVKVLRYQIWPTLRTRLPDARIHVCGAYPTQQILSMHDKKLGFIVHGHVEDIDKVLLESRVLLAPLRFGAGCKGKIIDAWRCGLPVVTTPVGAEGMTNKVKEPTKNVITGTTAEEDYWGGMVASDTNAFVDAAVEMYTQKNVWTGCRDNGVNLLHQLFNGAVNLPVVENRIDGAIADLSQRRRLDFTGAMLWRDNRTSTKYFSKWIELKESLTVKDNVT